MFQKAPQFLLAALVCLASVQGAAKSTSRYDAPNPWASADICQMRAEDFLAKAQHPLNLTFNRNAPGPLYTGLCWWHSKMQRAALYLAVFDQPKATKPTSQEATAIFRSLENLESVISIPGFSSWFAFTDSYRTEFYQALGDWEIRESLQLGFLKGLRATGKTDLSMIQKISDEVNDYKRLTFVLLKMPYLEAHSWIVQSMSTHGKHFEMGFIDSNYSSSVNKYQSQGNRYYLTMQNSLQISADSDGKILYNYAWEPEDEIIEFSREKGPAYPSLAGPTPMSLYLQNDNLAFQKMTAAIKAKCGGETPFTLHEKEVVKRKLQKEFERQNWYRPGVPHN